MNKTNRLISILELVKRLKVANPQLVLQYMASQLQRQPDDPNLIRNIYRDLQHLADAGRLQVRYLSSDGKEISPDESESKNLRIEYFVPQQSSSRAVQGAGLFDEVGGIFHPPVLASMEWSFTTLPHVDLEKHLHLLFAGRQVIALRLPVNQVPAQVLFARTTGQTKDDQNMLEEVRTRYGQRTAVILLPDKSVSRYRRGEKLGHALLTLNSDGTVLLTDLGSSSGTFVAPLHLKHIAFFESERLKHSLGTTRPLKKSPFSYDFQPMRLTEETAIGTASAINLANFRFCLVTPAGISR